MFRFQVICSGRIWYCAAVKPSSLVPNSDGDFSVYAAAAYDMNSLVGILMVAVYYRVRKGLVQRHFDFGFPSVSIPELPEEAYDLGAEWRNGLYLTREGLLQLNKRTTTRRSRQERVMQIFGHLANKLFQLLKGW
jgi:hypothetical protein